VPSSVMLPSLRAERIKNMTKTNKHVGFLNESMKSVKSGTTRDLALTASAPQGARADARTGITSFIRGSSNRVITSSGLEWEGVFPGASQRLPSGKERFDRCRSSDRALHRARVARRDRSITRPFCPVLLLCRGHSPVPCGPDSCLQGIHALKIDRLRTRSRVCQRGWRGSRLYRHRDSAHNGS
jgi:hypothetical protein